MNFSKAGVNGFGLTTLGLFLLFNCHSQKEPERCFSIVKYQAGDGPESIKIADVNNDRYPDIIIANIKSNDVSIMLNDGQANFIEAHGSPFSAGNSPQDISMADFNNDGNLDMALANHEVNYITVLKGDGEGKFQPMKNSPFLVQSQPHVHAISNGDFNMDGRLDLVVDSWEDDKIEVLYGNTEKGFDTAGPLFVVGPIMTIPRFEVADVNQDKHVDVLISSQGGKGICIALGDGNGNFSPDPNSPVSVTGHVYSLALDDLDKDGMSDLLIPHAQGNDSADNSGLTVLKGNGKGGFKKSQDLHFRNDIFPINVGVGDVDGDNWKEVVLLNQKGNNVLIFRGSEEGISEEPYNSLPVGHQPYGMDVGDLNQDKKADIVVSSTVDNEFLVMLSECK